MKKASGKRNRTFLAVAVAASCAAAISANAKADQCPRPYLEDLEQPQVIRAEGGTSRKGGTLISITFNL